MTFVLASLNATPHFIGREHEQSYKTITSTDQLQRENPVLVWERAWLTKLRRSLGSFLSIKRQHSFHFSRVEEKN